MIEIKYLEKGDSKNCLFFIHGFCSGPEDWDAQINFFSNKFSVIAPTLRGHDGKNTKERPMSIEQLSNDCVSIIKEKKFNKVILIGHSMGTRLAIDIANKINNAFGIVLVDGSRFANENFYGDTIKTFEDAIANESYITVLENMFASMFFSKEFDDDKTRIVKRAINIPEKYSLPLRRNAIWYDSHCVDKNLNNLTLPILILHSTKLDMKTGRSPIKEDESLPYIDFIKSFNLEIKVKKFEKTGHYISIEKPSVTNNIIDKWLAHIKVNVHNN